LKAIDQIKRKRGKIKSLIKIHLLLQKVIYIIIKNEGIMNSRIFAKRQKINRKLFILVITFLFLSLSPAGRLASRDDLGQVSILSAGRNLQVDTWGRVVDITFNQPVTLTFPDDNARFEVDITRPLGRDLNLSVGDLNGDGIADLLANSFDGSTCFYPGLDSHPYRFGKGQFVRNSNWFSNPFFGIGNSALWEGNGIADFDGDGVKDVVIGFTIYSMVNPNDPTLMKKVHTLNVPYNWDVFPSVGDLDDDGKPDIITTDGTVYDKVYFHRNQSTPGKFSFQRELLTDHYRPGDYGLGAHCLSLADLNSDGLLDLIGYRHIFFNKGLRKSPAYKFDNPTPCTITDGPWVDGVKSDQGISIFMYDGDQDGLIDAYVSNHGSSIWQGSFYKNVGTSSSPSFKFQSPVLCRSTPYDNCYRGYSEPNFSPHRVYTSAGDVNQDGLLDILLSDGTGTFSNPTVLWNRSTSENEPHFSCMDIYTFHTEGYPEMNPYNFFKPNWLPDFPLAWKDYTGDGLEDIIRTNCWMFNFDLYFLRRNAAYPVRFDAETALKTVTGAGIKGMGVAEFDMDGDGVNDFIFGSANGQLSYHHNQGSNSNLVLSDPVALVDLAGVPVGVGENSWPARFDWDGDGDFDLLVGDQTGLISIFLNESGKFIFNGYLSSEGWNPVDLIQYIGGGVLTPSLATGDFNGDQLIDMIGGGDGPACIWYFKNAGTLTQPSFTSGVISVDRTIPGYVKKLGDYTYRLYFGHPVMPEETSVFFYESLTQNQPATCKISAEVKTVVISGTIKIGGEGFQGVNLTFSNEGGVATTDANGAYSHEATYGWSGTVTPAKTGYSFSPASRSYTNLTSDSANQDYTTTLLTYAISGNVNLAANVEAMKAAGGLSGVVMNGLPGNPVTDANGNYSASVGYGWSGTVTPAKTGYSFSPASRSYTNVTWSQTYQNYTATLLTYAISGNVNLAANVGAMKAAGGLSGVVMNGLPGSPVTDASGNYSASVGYGWSGTVTPAKTGYSFSPASRSYTNVTSAQADQNYTATLATYTLTSSVNPSEAGTVTKNPDKASYVQGDSVKLNANANSGYVFKNWSGDVPQSVQNTNPVTIIMDSNKSVTANFTRRYTLAIASGNGGTTNPAPGSYTYDSGTEVQITASPNADYRFSGWTGDAPQGHQNDNPIKISMDSNKSITANFIRQYTLTIAAANGGTTEPASGTYKYDSGTQVSVKATASSGFQFSGWSGDASGTTNPITITMDSNKSLTANFKAISQGGDGNSAKKSGCFIATAAYGTAFHPHLNLLRDFRDKYLMTNKLGRSFVDIYYKYSPCLADIISRHEALRVITRTSLMPLVAFSYSILHFGPAVTAIILLMIPLVPVLFILSNRRKLRAIEKIASDLIKNLISYT
jgi:uncharacterized repeat protein (TIGR02543 family)